MEISEAADLQEFDMTTDQALISALTPKVVGEIELHPFSLMRQFIAIDLCHWSSGSNLVNVVVTVWICTLSEREALKAHQDVTQAQLDAFKWAEAQGYSMVEYKPIMDAYERLNRELIATTNARLRTEGNDGAPKKTIGERPAS